MRTFPWLLLLSASLLAGVNAHAAGLPICSAKHKRPANLYGSVLSEGLKPVVASANAVPPKPAAMETTLPAPATAPGVKPAQVSRSDLKASFAPCVGDRA